MKSRSFCRPAVFRAAALVQAMSGLLLLSLPVAVKAQEQALQPDALAEEIRAGSPPSIWVVPRVSVSLGYTDNGNFATQSQARQSDVMTEISPGVGVVVNNARLKGFLDYSVRGIYDTQRTVSNNIQQALNANGTLNAWDNRAFIDFSGVIGQQAISAFESPSADSVSNRNLSETSSFRFSPYLRGVLAGSVDYELRYGWQTSRTDTTQRSDITTQEGLVRLGSRGEGQSLGWLVEAGRTKADYTLGAQQTLDAVNGRLFYAVTPTLTLSALAGVESNNLLTPDMKSYRATGLGLEWRPSERTRVVVERANRYFGAGHNVDVEYRSRRSILRYADSRDVSINQLDGVPGSQGTLYGLIDALSTEPDPVLRAQQVNAELQRLGLPANSPISAGFLTSQATVQRSQELSLGVFGQRNAVIVAVARTASRRVNPMIMLSDDFNLASDIVEKAFRVSFAHRVTPLTSLNASLMRQTAAGVNTTSRYALNTLTLGVSTRLALRTSGAVQFRRAHFSGANPYKETAVLGVITHRF